MVRVHGHRGARGKRPENTLEAFEYAIAAGADAIEMDIAVTRDDVPVVSHDPWLAEGTPIRHLTWAAARERAPAIPSLSEVLDLGYCGEFLFNIEIKSFPERPELAPQPDTFTALVLREIERHGVRRRSMLQSFDFRILHVARETAPQIPRGALFESGDDFVAIAREAGAGIVVPEFQLVTEARVHAAHAAGLEVYTWTSNRAQEWSRLIAAGVDALITDDPAGLLAYLKGQPHL
jgi:glycerophosphoryl diester phosphodiesterase